jgi:hypothetical protein
MKTILPVWLLLYLSCLTDIYGQTACDSTLAGLTVNLSLGSNCQLTIDTSSARNLITGALPELTYNPIVVTASGDTVFNNTLLPEHIGQTLNVTITGSGCAMNSSGGIGAWAMINLEDKIAPEIICTDTTLSCIDFFFFRETGGKVHDCDLDTVQTVLLNFESACGTPDEDDISTIANRIFRATDNSGNSDTCTQQIRVRRLQESDISFPTGDLTFSCDLLTSFTNADGSLIAPDLDLVGNDPDDLSLTTLYPFGVPTGSGASFFGNNFRECRVRARFQDLPPDTIRDNTVRYNRFWTVTEWSCDNEEVEYTRVQTITFTDTTSADFSFVQDTLIFDLDPDDCSITVPITELSIISMGDGCFSEPTLNFEIVAPFTTNSPSNDTTLFIGVADTSTVTIRSYDFNGASVTKSLTVITRDNTNPVAICYGALDVSLNNTSEASMPVSSFNVGSFDACDGNVTFSARKMTVDTFSTDKITFDCSDGTEAMVQFRVTDGNGLSSICMTMVTIDTTGAACNVAPMANNSRLTSVNGFVRHLDRAPLDRTEVVIENLPGLSATTNKEGFFEFDSIPVGADLVITPVLDNNPLLGITTLDVILLQQHLLGLDELDSPYQIIAGDVNLNGLLDAGDLIEIRRLILGSSTEFTTANSFSFIPEAISFIDPFDPFENGQILGLSTILNNSDETFNFNAIKMGDVNQSYLEADQRSSESITMEYEIVEMGRYVELNIKAKTDIDILGLQSTLQYNPELLQLMKVGTNNIGLTTEHYNDTRADEGLIPISWNELLPKAVKAGDVIFRATFERMYDDDIAFAFNSSHMPSELYQEHGRYQLRLEKANDVIGQNFTVFQNAPNPWASSTAIEFSIPEGGEVELNIYDTAMNKLVSKSAYFDAGKNSFIVDYSDLESTGIYIYEITHGDQVRVSKMTKL